MDFVDNQNIKFEELWKIVVKIGLKELVLEAGDISCNDLMQFKDLLADNQYEVTSYKLIFSIFFLIFCRLVGKIATFRTSE